ncbi:MAG TPA: DUF169 domain-containing protein [Anaeromyxobacteraceae bacterium]|nr:DUF169 domain-containing protein [Anaeromyxobacteraceae bacterium]
MSITVEGLDRLRKALYLDTPIVAIYDGSADPEAFRPSIAARGRSCCFAYYDRWCKGETLVVERCDGDFERPSQGCPGLQRAVGLVSSYPAWMAHFLTDGKGAPMGEGLKATPEIAQAFLDRARPVEPGGDRVLMGPLRVEHWDKVRSVTFFADPDRLSALITLASYWSSDPEEVVAPFSSGCGLMWRELVNQNRDRAILGATDIAMRRYLPPHLMALSVSPARFQRMVNFPDDAFPCREWWKELATARHWG